MKLNPPFFFSNERKLTFPLPGMLIKMSHPKASVQGLLPGRCLAGVGEGDRNRSEEEPGRKRPELGQSRTGAGSRASLLISPLPGRPHPRAPRPSFSRGLRGGRRRSASTPPPPATYANEKHAAEGGPEHLSPNEPPCPGVRPPPLRCHAVPPAPPPSRSLPRGMRRPRC